MKAAKQNTKATPSPLNKPLPRKDDNSNVRTPEPDQAEQEDYPDKLISLEKQKRQELIPPGDMPQGLEEERRGHSMNSQDEDETRSQELPLGRDEKLHGIDDV